MAFWVVRAGKHGEGEGVALAEGVAVVGWDEVGDLRDATTADTVRIRVVAAYPELTSRAQGNWTGQLNAFRNGIARGDLIGLPLKGQPYYAFGEVTGDYAYAPDAPGGTLHRRPVRWLSTNTLRSLLDQDVQFSMGGLLTVFQPGARDAEARVRRLLTGRSKTPTPAAASQARYESPAAPALRDLEELARTQIADLLQARFKGHALSRLVAEVLETYGFVTTVSPAGADGGVDVLAGKGPLGFETPRLVVQVKSGQSPIDAPTVRELQGVMSRYGADHGLFVSWGGFRGGVESETKRDHFRIRLWNSRTLIDEVLACYDSLPESTRLELPLRRIWTVSASDLDG